MTKEAPVEVDLIVETAKEISALDKETAFEVIPSLIDSVGFSNFKLGGVLSAIQDNDWWQGESANFRSYIEDNFGLHYRKATYLINFIRFVEWPQQSLANDADEISLCIFGAGPFDSFIDEILEVKQLQIDLRKVHIDRLQKGTSLDNCHALFVSEKEMQHFNFETIRRDDLLLVGETPEFARRGGLINFFVKKDSVQFEINFTVLKQSKLKISSQLLKLTRVAGN